MARAWLIENISVEENHADWWRAWALGCGCTSQQIDHAQPSAITAAVDHYLWHICTHGSLSEGIAACNVGIEWPTGEWAEALVTAAPRYLQHKGKPLKQKSLQWLRAHAVYDDRHPFEAMEIVEACCHDAEEIQRAQRAATRALEYYYLALDDCLTNQTGALSS